MDAQTKLAVFSGIGSGVAAVITGIIINKLIKLKHYIYIPNKRRKALEGVWEGKISQIEGPDDTSIRYPITIKLKVGWKSVKGRASYNRKGRTINLKIKGGFSDQRFIKIEYINEDSRTIQNGYSIYSLNNSGNQINGKFIGIGIMTQDLVYGDIELKKKP